MKVDSSSSGIEMKTPLKAPKRYRKGKKSADEVKVEEFMSFSSSSYFNIEEEKDEDTMKDGTREEHPSSGIEKRIDDWLNNKNIFKADPGTKKDLFFEDKRARISSVSFVKVLREMDSPESSPFSRTTIDTFANLQFTPENSKLCQKRSSFASMLKITTSKDSFDIRDENQDLSPEPPRWRRIQSSSEQRGQESDLTEEPSLRELSTSLNQF